MLIAPGNEPVSDWQMAVRGAESGRLPALFSVWQSPEPYDV